MKKSRGLQKFKEDIRNAGRKNPELLEQKLQALELSCLELTIMKLRYIDGLMIKQIPAVVFVGERWIEKVHAKAVSKALDGLTAADLLELGIHIKATPKTLYEA